MFGMRIEYFCPKCKNHVIEDLVYVQNLTYKLKKDFVLTECAYCGTQLAVDEGFHKNNLKNNIRYVEDNTKENLINKIFEYFKQQNYNEKTSEYKMEEDLFNYAISVVGEEVVYKNEYEIKYIIQWLIANTFNIPTKAKPSAYIYEDIKNDSKITGSYLI